MIIDQFRNRTIHLIGISGAEGSSVASFLLKQGYTNLVGHDHVPESGFQESFFRFHDWMTEEEKEASFSKLRDSGIRFHFEDTYLQDIEIPSTPLHEGGRPDIVFVPQSWFRYDFNQPLRKYFGEDLKVKEEFKDRIWSMTKLYLELFPGKVVGVTGSNGKSTTTAMIAAILKAHLRSFVHEDDFRPSSPRRGEELEVRGPSEAILLERAKVMRSSPTEAEQKLWRQLQGRGLEGYKFKRQKPIGPYIVDFVCLEKQVIVEVDGSQHAEERDGRYDEKRTAWLEAGGYTVLRFWNNDVLRNMDGVWIKILEALEQAPHPTLSPLGRGRIQRLYWGGNDRKNPQPLDKIEGATEGDVLLLEMSNRQLSLGLGKSPNVAVITNVVSNHLDDHGTWEAYVRVKEEIVRYQTESDTAVLNWNNIPSREAKNVTVGNVVFFDLNDDEKPLPEGFVGTRREENELVSYDANGTRTIMANVTDVAVPGEHNVENALAAIAATTGFGISPETIQTALRSFGGLDHRLELVAEKDGVKYVNDSSGCSPLNIVMAVKALPGNLILIMGGYRKNPSPGEFLPVAEAAKEPRIKHLFLIGSVQEVLEKELLEGGVEARKIVRCTNLEEAFTKAKDMAKSGDTVALTPGCESFGEFRDYRERGEGFRSLTIS